MSVWGTAGRVMMRNRRVGATLAVLAALLAGGVPSVLQAKPEPYIRQVGRIQVGDTVSLDVEYDAGNELFIAVFQLPVDVTEGSGLGFSINSLGSVADTEIALYGPNGRRLVACNDDGRVGGSWGDPVLASVLNFGDLEQGDPATGWNGSSVQTGREPFVNPTSLPAGTYVVVMSAYEHIWDETDVRRSAFQGARWGRARLTLQLVDLN